MERPFSLVLERVEAALEVVEVAEAVEQVLEAA